MDVGARGDAREKELAERQRKCIAHCIDDDVRNQKAEGIVCENQRAQGLPKEGKVWPSAA